MIYFKQTIDKNVAKWWPKMQTLVLYTGEKPHYCQHITHNGEKTHYNINMHTNIKTNGTFANTNEANEHKNNWLKWLKHLKHKIKQISHIKPFKLHLIYTNKYHIHHLNLKY